VWTEYLGLCILQVGLCLLATIGFAILIPLIANSVEGLDDRHVQSNCEDVEHLAVILDGRYPQEADEQEFKGVPFIAVCF
jgi:hypothetical protein